MRISHTVATLASIAMLAFTLFACEDEEKKQTKAEAVASSYVTAAFKMDIETLKKITTGTALEKMLLTESSIKSIASSKGISYEEAIKEMTAELTSKGELDIKSATKVSESDDGKIVRVIVYAGKKGDDMAVPTAIVLAKQGGNWKVMDTPKQ